MGQYVEALNEFDGTGPSLFLAGGITGCADWQKQVAHQLAGLPIAILNPCRTDFPIDDPSAATEQIEWEHRYLRKATAILFWFPCETLCPITLYELGAWSMTPKPLFIGAHPDYRRREDVLIQTRLVRPEVRVVESIDRLLEQVRAWVPIISDS